VYSFCGKRQVHRLQKYVKLIGLFVLIIPSIISCQDIPGAPHPKNEMYGAKDPELQFLEDLQKDLKQRALTETTGDTYSGPNKQPAIVIKINQLRVECPDWHSWMDCGVGEKGKNDHVSATPMGTFKVISKSRNPVYIDVHGKFIAGPYISDKNNVYGTRIIVLNYKRNGRHLCIHGTNEENLIPGYISHMCVRLKNEDVEWLYRWLNVGDTVVIEE
jgi:L,D-transpeptidase catalytic domain